ncbi:hypothetical protein HHI36_013822 [Cryptolaemus montrouzieri]|uniref:Uncharacterized protein n=1 Tax=Cryptolaemus montrouzieri TaxID=559131 RepID=A0ABD2N125_9CUCU
MTIFNRILRCLCMCIVIKRGTWSPHSSRTLNSRAHLRRKYIRSRPKLSKNSGPSTKPDWLKQWTISKGWMHNRSHLLNLGTNTVDNSMETKKDDADKQDKSSVTDSSISIENIDDLISIISGEDNGNEIDLDQIDVISTSSSFAIEVKEETKSNTNKDVSEIFIQSSKNYRLSFSDHLKFQANHQPIIYQGIISSKKNKKIIAKIWEYLKATRQSEELSINNNQIYGGVNAKRSYGNDEDRNQRIELTNALDINSENKYFKYRKNLQEEVIYECSEESNSLTIYHNPIYVSEIQKYYDFRTNHSTKPGNFSDRLNALKKRKGYAKISTWKRKIKTERHIIQHIKVRFMLTMRMDKDITKLKTRKIKHGKLRVGMYRADRLAAGMFADGSNEKIPRIHDEQKRIGNGRTSLKIQNFRYVVKYNSVIFLLLYSFEKVFTRRKSGQRQKISKNSA